MDELLKELDSAYRMISSIAVSGDSVDVMAAARAKLRKVYVGLKDQSKEVESDG